MSVTIDELERRLSLLEQEVARLRQQVETPPGVETPAERGERLLREAEAGQAALSPGWAWAMEQMGIKGEPVGVEKLREMIAACGFKPENNEFSRGIIEMREE
jgi:hypothetical protein